jgi:fluoroquinolone transport system permease protein
MSALGAYALADLRSVARDPLLRFVLVAPPALALLGRFGLPALEAELAARTAFDLAAHRPTVVAFLYVMVVPMLFGMISGLLLAEDRDAGTFRALLVTPVSFGGYLGYRAGVATVATGLAAPAAALASGLFDAPAWRLAPGVALAGLVAAGYAVLFGAAASDRLEALAVMKATTLLTFAPLAARDADLPAQIALGVIPTAWPAYAVWAAIDGGGLVGVTVAGVGVTACWVAAGVVVFRRRVRGSGG